MAEAIPLRLPDDPSLLEEVNLPTKLVRRLAGRTVSVEVIPAEAAGTRRVEPDDYPLLIDREGNCWNDYRPIRVRYIDVDGHLWRFPRHWLPGWPENVEQAPAAAPVVSQELAFHEEFQMPTVWDLSDVNIPNERVAGTPSFTKVEVRISPPNSVRVFWYDRGGDAWRLPRDWRRRRIQLPASDVLAAQEVPAEVAAEYGNRILTVNYHPGSLCCLPEQYRFRDAQDRAYPVRIKDCLLLGYGSESESRA
jgi:hypothetical protein